MNTFLDDKNERFIEGIGILKDVYQTYYGMYGEMNVSGYISFWTPATYKGKIIHGANTIERVKFYDNGIRAGQVKNHFKEGAKVMFKLSLGYQKKCWDIRIASPPNLVLVERPRYEQTEKE